jgi:hypothetical protein
MKRCLIGSVLCVVLVSGLGCEPTNGLGQYRLRHDFSLDPGLPGGSKSIPTSCYFVGDGEYLCRLVHGYEEAGSKQNFEVAGARALRTAGSSQHGSTVITTSGAVYEGCVKIDGGRTWYCDYRTSNHVSRRHYGGTKRHVLRVFWDWQAHTRSQASCATGMAGLWVTYTRPAFAAMLNDCLNGPL